MWILLPSAPLSPHLVPGSNFTVEKLTDTTLTARSGIRSTLPLVGKSIGFHVPATLGDEEGTSLRWYSSPKLIAPEKNIRQNAVEGYSTKYLTRIIRTRRGMRNGKDGSSHRPNIPRARQTGGGVVSWVEPWTRKSIDGKAGSIRIRSALQLTELY